MSVNKQNTNMERKSFVVVSEHTSDVTAKWNFSAGSLYGDDEDFCWENQASVSTIQFDFEDDSSIMDEDEFAEDVVEDIKDLQYHRGPVKQHEDKPTTIASPAPHQPSPHELRVQNCYKEFMELSSPPRTKKTSAFTPAARLNKSLHHPRSSTLRRNRRSKNHSLSSSDHNRGLIRSSMNNLLDLH